jgi:hypothetical protein
MIRFEHAVANVAQRIGEVWTQRNGMLKSFQSTGMVPLFLKRHGEIVVGFGVLRIQLNGAAIAFGRFINNPRLLIAAPRLLCQR